VQELFESLKQNMKVAAKSVRYNLKLYLPFFAAVFIIQLFFGVLLFSAGQASREEKILVERDYWYHVAYYDLNESQMLYLKRYDKNNDNAAAIYEIVKQEESTSSTVSEPRYDLYLMMLGEDTAAVYKQFTGRFLPSVRGFAEDDETLRYSETPLIGNNGQSATAGTTLSCVLLFGLSVVLLTVLYTVRINNYKFEYGIYMSFGADFKKLSENAIYEMLLIALLPYLPALLLSYAGVCLIYGKLTVFGLGAVLLTLVLSLTAALSSCFFPMFVVSKIFPMTHIRAVDNSNYVSSPRLSFEMLGRSLKRHYGNFSLFRFRKYYAKIVLTACAFTVVASAAFYGAGLFREKNALHQPQFRIALEGGYPYDEELAAELHDIEGVYLTEKACTTVAAHINSHLMFLEGQTVSMSGLAVAERYSKYFAFGTDKVDYRACDAETIAFLQQYEHEGDLNTILTDDRAVIISENMRNTRVLDVAVGDKIYAAVSVGRNPESKITFSDLQYLKDNALFKAKLEFYEYQYIELTVAAILKDCPSGDDMPLYLSHSGYQYVTQPTTTEPDPVEYTSVMVYADPAMNAAEITDLENRLSLWCRSYGDIALYNLQALGNRQIDEMMQTPALFGAVSILIFLLSPVIWFFSQIIFYRKRRSEMDILYSLGAIESELRALHMRDGILLGGISAVVTGLLSWGTISLIYRTVNRAAGATMFYHDSFPLGIVLAAVVLSALCAFFSVYVSYRLYQKSRGDLSDIFSGE